MNVINKPWVILHEADNGKMRCELAGPSGVTHEHFAMVLADAIQHVARAFSVDVEDVAAAVRKELDSPTTEIKGNRVQ